MALEDARRIRLERLRDEFCRLHIDCQASYGKLHLHPSISRATAVEGSNVTVQEHMVMFDDCLPPVGSTVVEQLMSLGLNWAYEVAAAGTTITLPQLTALSSLVIRNTGALHLTSHGECDKA